MMEARPAVEAVEVGTDGLTVLHADPGIVHEIRDASRRIDLIVGAADRTRLRLDDLRPVRQELSPNLGDGRDQAAAA
jgi:hypothetical protein